MVLNCSKGLKQNHVQIFSITKEVLVDLTNKHIRRKLEPELGDPSIFSPMTIIRNGGCSRQYQIAYMTLSREI